ncbi:MAG TPA: hypothetical protein ENL08_03265 [Bacteroidetes bacterium]|nr:hypothetical protein [Bacteroidota bacterium]
MDWIYRELTGVMLSEQVKVAADDVRIINSLSNPPPVPVTVRDIYVRRCRLAGDAVDAGFGRFRTGDLDLLLDMLQGAPALVGHRKDTLGVARFFGGGIERNEQTGVSYIVPKFYWMRLHSASEDLRVNIDGGIYNEASLGFTFRKPTCGICGEDIRRCEHVPGREYDGKRCFFYYDELIKVTEGSFVYRGAQQGTGFMLAHPASGGLTMDNLPRFKWKGIWYCGVPEKLIIKEV